MAPEVTDSARTSCATSPPWRKRRRRPFHRISPGGFIGAVTHQITRGRASSFPESLKLGGAKLRLTFPSRFAVEDRPEYLSWRLRCTCRPCRNRRQRGPVCPSRFVDQWRLERRRLRRFRSFLRVVWVPAQARPIGRGWSAGASRKATGHQRNIAVVSLRVDHFLLCRRRDRKEASHAQ